MLNGQKVTDYKEGNPVPAKTRISSPTVALDHSPGNRSGDSAPRTMETARYVLAAAESQPKRTVKGAGARRWSAIRACCRQESHLI